MGTKIGIRERIALRHKCVIRLLVIILIEELAPKNLDENTYKIGNLTITGYNSTLGNKSFLGECDRQSKNGKRFIGYKSGLEINNGIAKLDARTVEDNKRRSEDLIQQLMEMFKIPSIKCCNAGSSIL